jgi:hypothetical protein
MHSSNLIGDLCRDKRKEILGYNSDCNVEEKNQTWVGRACVYKEEKSKYVGIKRGRIFPIRLSKRSKSYLDNPPIKTFNFYAVSESKYLQLDFWYVHVICFLCLTFSRKQSRRFNSYLNTGIGKKLLCSNACGETGQQKTKGSEFRDSGSSARSAS